MRASTHKWYHRQQNRYITSKIVRLSEKLQLTQHSVMKFYRSNKFDLCYYGLLRKLATAKIDCSFEMGK